MPGDLGLGRLVEGTLHSRGEIQYIRIQRDVHIIHTPPQQTPEPDDTTLGLWKFDNLDGPQVEDLSPLNNPGRFTAVPTPSGVLMPLPGPHITPTDQRLKVVEIDRSEDEVFMAVKVDSEGQLFVMGTQVSAPTNCLFRLVRDCVGAIEKGHGQGVAHCLWRWNPGGGLGGVNDPHELARAVNQVLS